MAKHRKSRRVTAPAMVAGATAGLSTALTFGQAAGATAVTIPAVDTVIGVGGAQNPSGDRIEQKFQGAIGAAGTFQPLVYTATLPIDPSVEPAVTPLKDVIVQRSADGSVLVVGYSEGSIVAELAKRQLDLQGSPGAAGGNVTFVYIAAPTVPNGGIYSRFPDFRVPGFTSTGPAATSPYDETFVSLEYDLIADFPAYANPISLANAVAGMAYFHGDQGPDNVDLETAPQSVLVVSDTENGTDTYVLVRAKNLPLLQPIRDVSSTLQATPVTEPFVSAAEPTLRVLVDAGYTSRDHRNIPAADDPDNVDGVDYQDAAEAKPFSLVTPPERIVESAQALPDAFEDGAENFVKAVQPAPAQNKTASDDDDKPATSAKKPKRGPVAKAVSRALDNLKPKKRDDPPKTEDDKTDDKKDDKSAGDGESTSEAKAS